jgi:hypothetical protein
VTVASVTGGAATAVTAAAAVSMQTAVTATIRRRETIMVAPSDA